jgi:FlaA1/EpsC-like NDP-sugar epimerase
VVECFLHHGGHGEHGGKKGRNVFPVCPVCPRERSDRVVKNTMKNMNVLVTGACGTVGRELSRQLLEVDGVASLVAVDNNESELFFQEQRFLEYPNSRFLLGDVRDLGKLERVMRGMDIVFHAAAYKHVVLCERSPFEAVQTNILGVQNVILAARATGVKRVVFTSSDKAVNPTNVMGTSKLMGERLISAANVSCNGEKTIFTSTRFGNVLGSRGSVVPIFREQIRKGGPVTLTNPGMTRFIMGVRDAVRLVIDSALLARGGEVLVTKMPCIRISDLAEVMIRELAPRFGHDPDDVSITTIGCKPGEKLYEELMTAEEVRRTLELEHYFVIRPAFSSYHCRQEPEYPGVVAPRVTSPYNSDTDTPLTRDNIRHFLYEHGLLDKVVASEFIPDRRFWGDEKTGGEGC